MIPLTDRQKQLLDYLRSCNRCPSYIEMRDALGLTSKSGVHRLITALEERGFVRRLPNRSRAIELVEDAHLPRLTVPEIISEATSHGLVVGRLSGKYFCEVTL